MATDYPDTVLIVPQPKRVEVAVGDVSLSLSNLDKLMYPRAGFTKGHVIDYYTRIAPVLLDHLRARPLTLKRYPDGVEGGFFYEKRCPSHRPAWVKTAAVWSGRKEGDIDYCLCEDLPTVVWLANLADLELHTPMARAPSADEPTMIAFDLDPGAADDGRRVRAGGAGSQGGVRSLRPVRVRQDLRFQGHAGLSAAEHAGRDLRAHAGVLARGRAGARAARAGPGRHRHGEGQAGGQGVRRLVAERPPQDDGNVYSLRAMERPTVSTPVTWDEVSDCADGAPLSFDSGEVLERVAAMGDLFAEVQTLEQELPR